MGRWLEQLRKNVEKTPDPLLTKPTKAPSVSSVSPLLARSEKLLPPVAPPDGGVKKGMKPVKASLDRWPSAATSRSCASACRLPDKPCETTRSAPRGELGKESEKSRAVPWACWDARLRTIGAHDLPPGPFRLRPAVYVENTRRFLEALHRDFQAGPGSPRARNGALQDDIIDLERIMEQIRVKVLQVEGEAMRSEDDKFDEFVGEEQEAAF
jgi:hypothetical protein